MDMKIKLNQHHRQSLKKNRCSRFVSFPLRLLSFSLKLDANVSDFVEILRRSCNKFPNQCLLAFAPQKI